MSATRWTFRLANGQTITGPVQGSGGTIDKRGGRERLLASIKRARASAPLSIYEPSPGHVRVYPDYSVAGNGEPVDVDLRTAELLP